MWIKTKWLPVFNQNCRFKGISLVSLVTFNQIKSFSTQSWYADSNSSLASLNHDFWNQHAKIVFKTFKCQCY